MRTFIIAEAGVNHNADESLALRLVDIAAECGADAVKFQTFVADKLVVPGTMKAEYQRAAGGEGDQHAMLRSLEMSRATHRKVFERCAVAGIEFMSTPFDRESVDFLVDLGMRRIKIPSGEITNEPLLRYIATKNLPIILSTGMATLDEVQRAVRWLGDARAACGFQEPLASVLTVLHCTSNYPTACEDVNLRAMQTIAAATDLPVGYSDHTLGLAVSAAAVALGASVIEKHFTSDRNLPGPDHRASLVPAELRAFVQQIRDIEAARGSATKEPTKSELPVRDLVRRSVTVIRRLSAGEHVGADDVAILRPGTGIPPYELDRVIGRRALRDIDAGTTLRWSDLQ